MHSNLSTSLPLSRTLFRPLASEQRHVEQSFLDTRRVSYDWFLAMPQSPDFSGFATVGHVHVMARTVA